MTGDLRARHSSSSRHRCIAPRRAHRAPLFVAILPLFIASLALADEPTPPHDPIATLLPTRSARLIVEAPAGARVSTGHDDSTILPAPPIELPAGTHDVKISLSGFRTRNESLRIAEGETRTLIAPLAPKLRTAAIARALVFPGLGSRYMERRIVSLALMGAAVAAGGGAIFYDVTMQSRVDEFDEIDARYASAVSATEVATLARQRDAAYAEIRDAEDIRGICLVALAGAYAAGIAEAALLFPWNGEDRRAEIGPRIDALAPGEIRMTLLSISRR